MFLRHLMLFEDVNDEKIKKNIFFVNCSLLLHLVWISRFKTLNLMTQIESINTNCILF